MEEDELLAFREHWKQELKKTTQAESTGLNLGVTLHSAQPSVTLGTKSTYFKDRSEDNERENCSDRSGHYDSPGSSYQDQKVKYTSPCTTLEDRAKHQPQYVSIAEGLLDGRTSPLVERIEEERTRRKRQHGHIDCHYNVQPQKKVVRPTGQKLLDQFIQDLNDTNDIPFFDVELPYELALKIFQFLDRRDLGRCAQVSKVWKGLADDDVLWYNLCLEEGYHSGANVSDSPCWKSSLRDCRNTDKLVCSNWKNRVGSISHLQFELGKILCDVSCCSGYVFSGYTSGDVRLWDTHHWDSEASYLRPTHANMDVTLKPHISHVQVNKIVAAAAFEDGSVDVWSTETGSEPIHHLQHLQKVHALALCPDHPTVATACGTDVRVESPDEKGYWKTLCLTQLPKPVDNLRLVPGKQASPLAVASASESVYLLAPGQDQRVLHSVYGHPVTCLDVSDTQAAMGVKSCGWAMNDGGNKIQVYGLETGQLVASVGNSAGDFTCINLRDGPPHLLVCGNKDRRVRVFDLRSGLSVASLYAHHMGVTAVQGDDWKLVSGGGEGLVCVWEMRMAAKLWEMHNRHPVRHIWFDESTLVTANIPDEKSPRGACITDDDLTAHRRHRGVICLYDFSPDLSVQDHVLPICRSNYIESSGYNYNIGLAMPYDILREPSTS
ncbi:F-box/WD repeat-containing protein 8 [Alosa pseudoharengus]|uniref:F-box/WD repeat-containing protein 8 n=1 Tax=Alosa pseudoharengus TaxID=34774 RepID=UPI003F8B491C